ncbi:hypothetical protein [Paraburkholderia sp. J63]|uniref:hypothetical protein n=1 Tax=Paraburkholderia sp. J63 TaxID=2805434 RepID=UPI002ABDD577|nr:hypothetical protein [Paraburkholderia sp. J63]
MLNKAPELWRNCNMCAVAAAHPALSKNAEWHSLLAYEAVFVAEVNIRQNLFWHG